MNLSLVPLPQKIAVTGGVFHMSANTQIVSDEAALPEAQCLSAGLRPVIGTALSVSLTRQDDHSAIMLHISPEMETLGSEGYLLSVTREGITLRAAGRTGLFYGVQTLLQLADSSENGLPCVQIEDRPRFAWRGAMLDVSRHFLPKEFVLKFIDLLAQHKMNILQLHLTDDQGWRIEIKKYPKLTEIGAWRKETLVGRALINPSDAGFDPANQRFDGVPYGGFYTQEDAREIVAYAAARHVTVVPEIEMPGHAQAAIAAYPFLGCTDAPLEVSGVWGIHDVLYKPSEPTFEFLRDVLAEVMDIFPSPYIHVGGDEAVKTQWRETEECRQIQRELGLPGEEAMQSYFIGCMDEFITQSGRTLIGWDEILEGGLSPGAVVMSWRGEEGGIEAAALQHDVVMAPHRFTYFDYYQSDARTTEPLAFHELLTLPTVYGYDPIAAALPPGQEGHVLGTQCQLWTEYMPTSQQVEYQAFPRLCAFAEVAWTDKKNKDLANFMERLPKHLTRLGALEVNYRPL
jgi:hexosaminidase